LRAERVLITGARAPVALHLARLLKDAGCFVVMADCLRHSLAFVSRACDVAVVVPAFDDDVAAAGAVLAEVIDRQEITHVIPTCEEVFYLAILWQQREMGAHLFAPDLAQLSEVHDKYRFVQMVQAMGLSAPETVLLQSAADMAAVAGRSGALVFKPVWSRFGTDVQICPKTPRFTPSPRFPWVAQACVDGDLLGVHAMALDGAVTALAAYRPLYRAGQGAGTAFAPAIHDGIADFVRHFVAETGWTGQISFDFIEAASGLFAIECNPRATSGVHLFNAPDAFATAVFDGAVVRPDADDLRGVRLAMAVYGFWPALRRRRFGPYIRDIGKVVDVLAWPDDPGPGRKQWRMLAEVAGIAMRQRVSLQTAATAGIAWNGPS